MLVKTPPMGYNTWNTFGMNISADLIKETADAMVDEGLLAAGYNYLVIDDCWQEKERDPETGKIIPDKQKFPLGMNDVSDYVHSKGLKFGMYSCAGNRTCCDFPGSFSHEFLDAETFAEYGADFLKYDFCCKPEDANGPLLYRRMGMALRNCGRDILYSACNWGFDNVETWIRAAGADMYRSTGDINDCFEVVRDISLSQVKNLCCNAPGCFNDIDMLTVGMYGKGNVGTRGCNDTEYRLQFALWCMFGVPLMIGCDVRNMTPETKALLTNKELVRINQDPECRGVMDCSFSHWNVDRRVFVRHLEGGELALGFFNFSEEKCRAAVSTYAMGLGDFTGRGLVMKDVFTGEETGVIRDYYSVELEPHACTVYRAKVVRT